MPKYAHTPNATATISEIRFLTGIANLVLSLTFNGASTVSFFLVFYIFQKANDEPHPQECAPVGGTNLNEGLKGSASQSIVASPSKSREWASE